ncbi:gamma-glutamyl-phosphate reductase, partial [Streptomyces lavendulae]
MTSLDDATATATSPVLATARAARTAAAAIAPLPRSAKDAALLAIADALEARTAEIVTANAVDTDKARAAGTS